MYGATITETGTHQFDTIAWKGLLDDFDRLAMGLLPDGSPAFRDEDGFCRANRTSRKFTNLQEHAEWRPTANLSNEAGTKELLV